MITVRQYVNAIGKLPEHLLDKNFSSLANILFGETLIVADHNQPIKWSEEKQLWEDMRLGVIKDVTDRVAYIPEGSQTQPREPDHQD